MSTASIWYARDELDPAELLPSASTTARPRSAHALLDLGLGRLMFVTPPAGSTPLQPKKRVFTAIWSRIAAASGSTSECCSGRNVPPITTTVRRGIAGLEFQRRLQAIREHHHVGQLAARDERMRRRHGRRPDVEKHRLPGLDERRRRLADRALRLGELSRRLLERTLMAQREPRNRAAPNPVDLAAPRQVLKIAADRHARDPEALAQLADGHERPQLAHPSISPRRRAASCRLSPPPPSSG